MLKLRHWPGGLLALLRAIIAPRRVAWREWERRTNEHYARLADEKFLWSQIELARKTRDEAVEESKQLRDQLKYLDSRLEDSEKNYRKALNEIECLKVTIDGDAVNLERWRQQAEAFTRLDAMKGQPPRHEPAIYTD